MDRQLWMMLPNISEGDAFHVWRNANGRSGKFGGCWDTKSSSNPDDHHAHAASSYFFSGFSESAVLTVDGVGEWATTTYGYAQAIYDQLV